jgi:flagellar L-ring protein precursor FlgH
MNAIRTTLPIAGLVIVCGALLGAGTPGASSSILAQANDQPVNPLEEQPHALQQMSMFAIAPAEERLFVVHDLVQIVVRETSVAKSSQSLDTKKEADLDWSIPRSPQLELLALLEAQISAGRTTDRPALELQYNNEFKGDGQYERKDDLTARVTAEVIEILPNGNLVLEARTTILTDKEEQVITVTGTCRADDVTPANSVLSNQLHDLRIEKQHKGELRTTNERGFIGKVLDAIFSF